MNILLNFLLLPGILGIGISATLSDIKTGKVKNSLIKNGFWSGLLIYLSLFLWSVTRKYSGFLAIFFRDAYYLNFNYFFDLIINTVIALAVGIVLWKLNFWAAGDAKLFTLMSFLVPLTVYSREKIIYFPSFILLLNIYTICLLCLIFKGVLKFRIKEINPLGFLNKNKQKINDFLKKIPENFQPNKIFNFLNLILILSIIFSVILKLSLSSQLLVYLALFLIYLPLSGLLKKYKKMNIFIFPPLIIATFFIPDFWLKLLSKTNPFLRFFSGFFIFIIIIRIAANFLSKQTETKKIKLRDLQPNMILGEETVNILKQDKDFFRKDLGRIYFDGLSLEQTEKIKNFLQNKNLEEVEIYKTFPFAPFIFAGTIITLILHGSLLNWLAQFWR